MTALASLHYARPDEVRALEELRRRALAEIDGVEELRHTNGATEAVRISVVAVRDQRVRVAEGDGEPVGLTIVGPHGGDVVELEALVVVPEWLGRGVGRLLLDDVVAHAADEGATRIEVSAFANQLDFYRGHGFDGAGSVDTSWGPAVRLVRAVELGA